jgi:hypothetical protein
LGERFGYCGCLEEDKKGDKNEKTKKRKNEKTKKRNDLKKESYSKFE